MRTADERVDIRSSREVPELGRQVRGAGASLAVCIAALALAATASATSYCVGTQICHTSAVHEVDLTHALAAADLDTAGTDTIELPAGTQSAPHYGYDGTVALSITGQGEAVTTIATSDSAYGFEIATGAPSIALHGFTIKATGSPPTALETDPPAEISSVTISGDPSVGLILSAGGSVTHATLSLTNSAGSYGVAAPGSAPTTIADSSIVTAGDVGLLLVSASAVVTRCTVSAGGTALRASGQVKVDDSVLNAGSGAGILDYGTTVTGTQVTITGGSSATGVTVDSLTGSGTATVNLTDSIIADPLAHSMRFFKHTTGDTTITTDYSDYDHATIGAAGNHIAGTHDTTAYEAPGFIAGSDRLSPNSPLLGLDPTPIGGKPFGATESATDLDGLPRITGAGRDLGAYQHQPVTATASVAPTSVEIGTAVTFKATGSVARPSDPLTFAWKFDDGASATGATVSHTFKTSGSHEGTVIVSDAFGFIDSAVASLTVTAPGGSGGGDGGGGPGGGGSSHVPVITGLTEAHQRWSEPARAKRARTKQPHAGTAFKFTLNEAAQVTLAFTQPAPGRRVNGKCVAPSKRNAAAHHCTRRLIRGTLAASAHRGANRIAFTGSVHGGRQLAPGSYTLVLTATASRLTSKPRTLTFTIL
jgi:hypothetical protein